MKSLISILKKETENLRNQYVDMTAEWAVKDFNHLRQWVIDYKKGKFGFGEASKKYNRLPYYIVNSNGDVKQHVTKMVEMATEHYETSIQKLTMRIEKKGLDHKSLKVITSHIGVNIEITLTDGNKVVRAFTIIAGGEIQRPHYRYLIK